LETPDQKITRKTQYRWEDNIKEDICQMKVKNWTTLRPGSREMEEGGRWEGQNFQQL